MAHGLCLLLTFQDHKNIQNTQKVRKKKEKSVFTFYKHTINKTGSCEISNMYNICQLNLL